MFTITPYLYEYSLMGSKHTGTPKELFQKARKVGYQAEVSMMKATQNVNTHKGANFSYAVILPATAYT
ncbi:MAG TPA: triphosphoribosyl-dephospho-CoA synthase [Atopostipes sp.]|nr:triphosphoribosyl-dephospho-CoA synthase [Atopostipes sp.]